MTPVALRPAILAAERALAAAGVSSPGTDAEYLAAHVLELPRSRLALVSTVTPAQLATLRTLVARRADRVPLQHLTGSAALGDLDLAVGPGVFVPRPETELLLAWALAQLSDADPARRPIVVDLCTGSAALALAIAHARPDVEVHAVELEPVALAWARTNAQARADAGDTPIALHAGDVTDPAVVPDLVGGVDLLVANPPYIPAAAPLEPEVLDHDPHAALFGGDDGLSVIRPMVDTIARLLRPGGGAAVEHDDTTGEATAALFTGHGGFTEVDRHRDLAGRPRFVTARAHAADDAAADRARTGNAPRRGCSIDSAP